MNDIFGPNLLAIIFFSISIMSFATCSKKSRSEGAASPNDLLQKISDASTTNDPCRMLKYLMHEDRVLFVATEVFAIDMLITMNQTLGTISETTVGFMHNLAKTTGGNRTVNEAEMKKAREKVKSEIEEKTSTNRLKSGLTSVLKKHGLDSNTFFSIGNVNAENFQEISEELVRNLKGVDLISFCMEIEQLAAQSGVKREQRFSIGPFESNTIDVREDLATARIMGATQGDLEKLTMKKVAGRWYVSLKEIILDASGDTASQSRDGAVDSEEAKEEEHPSLRALKLALNGEWKGKNGTLKFDADGTAVFNIKSLEKSGKLVIDNFEIGLMEEDGSTNLYSAYLDSQNNLHVGVTDNVGALDQERKGRVPVDMFRYIEIGDKCHLVDINFSTKKTPIKCTVARKAGDQVFQFEIPDTFEPTKNEVKTLIYLEKEGLLVPSELRDIVYLRQVNK